MLSSQKRKSDFLRATASYFWGDVLPEFLLNKENLMKINPIRDRILIKPLDAETVTKSGIVIPDAAQEKPIQGKVLAVGTGKVTEEGQVVPLVVKEGDTVMYGKYAGQTVKLDNIEHVILKEDDVMAIVE